MKKHILDRYDKTSNDELIIKISTNKFENLFNNFDSHSSFLKKDLNQELVDYIIESASEISEENFIIRFYFNEEITKENFSKLEESFDNYFNYLEELEKKRMKGQIKNSFIFMLIGVCFILLSFTTEHYNGMITRILSEGLMIAGWVSMWEALATILIKWLPLNKKFKLFKKLINTKLEFENHKN